MSAPDDRATVRQSVEQANAALRAFVRAHGGRPWTPEDLAELDRLRAAWQRAVERGTTTAA